MCFAYSVSFFFFLILFYFETLHNCISFAKYQNESATEQDLLELTPKKMSNAGKVK